MLFFKACVTGRIFTSSYVHLILKCLKKSSVKNATLSYLAIDNTPKKRKNILSAFDFYL